MDDNQLVNLKASIHSNQNRESNTTGTTHNNNNYGSEKPYLKPAEVQMFKKKFSANQYQHFNILLKIKSPQYKYGKAPRERMDMIKKSITEVVGNPLSEN